MKKITGNRKLVIGAQGPEISRQSKAGSATNTSSMAWALEFDDEIVDYDSKTNTYYAWPVRGGQSGTADRSYPSNIFATGQIQTYYSDRKSGRGDDQ